MTLPPSTNINAFTSRILVYSVRYEVEQRLGFAAPMDSTLSTVKGLSAERCEEKKSLAKIMMEYLDKRVSVSIYLI